MSQARPGAGLLAGVRVLDMTWGIAGPVATRLMAEYGADVIKVEPPSGDPMRGQALFQSANRSKRGVVVDLHTAAGRARLDGLLATADVLVHGLRPGQALELGLDDASLADRFPYLIVSAVLGYPPAHRDADRPGYDILVQARSGAMDELTGHRPGPVFMRFAIPSWAAVHLVTAGVLARLVARDRTGRGGCAHTSLHQGMLAGLTLLWSRAERPSAALADKIPLTRGAEGMSQCLFECADGEWIQIATLTGYTEHPLVIETVLDAGYDFAVVDGWAPTEQQLAMYRAVFRRRPRDEWLRAFHEGDVPAGAVEALGSVFTDPQAIANHYVVEVQDPVWGQVTQAGSPFTVDPPARVTRGAPSLGEHDASLLTAPRPDTDQRREPAVLSRPLEGVRVLDVGMYVAGPLGPRLLADLGADVIKVEPVDGDRVRVFEAQLVGANRGKRSLALNLADPRSRPVLERLLRWADVVHHNLRRPAARRLGLDYDAVRSINPRAVVCHVSAYGPVGEKASWPGYDPTASAASGWASESAPPGAKPMWYRFGIWDVQTAMSSVMPTLMALRRRNATGEGSFVATSMLGIAALTNSETMRLADGRLAPYPKLDDDETGLHHGYRIFRLADDEWVAVCALGEGQLAALRAICGVEADVCIPKALDGRDAGWFLAALEAAGIPAERVVRDHEQTFFDSESGAGGLAASCRHPVYGTVQLPGALWDFGDLGLRLDQAPPLLGQHTREILTELGLDPAEVARLLDCGLARTVD